MASDRYGLYSASFNGTFDLAQLREQSISAGSRHRLIRPGGALNPAAHILATADARKRFATPDLLTVFTNVDIANGVACASGSTMRYQKRLPAGAFATGASHFTVVTAAGFMHIASLGVDIDSETGAECELEYIPLSADGTNPVAVTGGVNFSTAPIPAYNSIYYLGGVWLGASQIESLTSVRISPGIQFKARRVDGGVFPRYGASSIVAREPMIELTFLNTALPYVMGSLFTVLLGSAIKIYLQRGTADSDGRIAPATTGHYKITAATGSWGHDQIRVSEEDDATVTVQIRPTGVLTVTPSIALGA